VIAISSRNSQTNMSLFPRLPPYSSIADIVGALGSVLN
jgi:hypothetical protein